jgi:hypothetical protein
VTIVIDPKRCEINVDRVLFRRVKVNDGTVRVVTPIAFNKEEVYNKHNIFTNTAYTTT